MRCFIVMVFLAGVVFGSAGTLLVLALR